MSLLKKTPKLVSSLLTAVGMVIALLAATTAPASADPASYTLWGDGQPTTNVATFDTESVNLKTRFTVSVPGTISTVRFYKADGNQRADGDRVVGIYEEGHVSIGHTGYLQPGDETASGWQTATLSVPFDVVPGKTYYALYTSFGGVYAYEYDVFAAGPITNGPLTAVGSEYMYVYRYDENGDQLHGSYRDSGYFVTPVFVPAA